MCIYMEYMHTYMFSIVVYCLVAKLYPTSFVTPWTVAHQVPLSMEFSRQEYWSGLPFPSPGDLPDSRMEPVSPALAGGFFTTEPPGKPIYFIYIYAKFAIFFP